MILSWYRILIASILRFDLCQFFEPNCEINSNNSRKKRIFKKDQATLVRNWLFGQKEKRKVDFVLLLATCYKKETGTTHLRTHLYNDNFPYFVHCLQATGYLLPISILTKYMIFHLLPFGVLGILPKNHPQKSCSFFEKSRSCPYLSKTCVDPHHIIMPSCYIKRKRSIMNSH